MNLMSNTPNYILYIIGILNTARLTTGGNKNVVDMVKCAWGKSDAYELVVRGTHRKFYVMTHISSG